MARLERNLKNREWLLERLRAEVIGPDPAGDPLVIEKKNDLIMTWEEFRKPKRQQNGEEILWQDSPIKRYGAGILFPKEVTELKQLAEEAQTSPEEFPDSELGPDVRVDETIDKKVENDFARIKTAADDNDDYDVTLANAYRPSAMGLSFLGDFSVETEGIFVSVECAVYEKLAIKVGQDADSTIPREVWLRKPCLAPDGSKPSVILKTTDLMSKDCINEWVPGLEGRLQILAVSRKHERFGSSRRRLITICIINCQQKSSGRLDEVCFFQAGFHVRGVSQQLWIVPYPEVIGSARKDEDEEQITRLLYRDRQTFAVGHGCAANWPGIQPAKVVEISTDCLPSFETTGVSADVRNTKGELIRVSMRKLAGLDPADNGAGEVETFIEAYRNWIGDLEPLETRNPPIPDDLAGTAKVLINRCKACLDRIEDGWKFLNSGTSMSNVAKEAFSLANHAMLISQLRSSREIRLPRWEDGRLLWDTEMSNPDPVVPHPSRGYWRAFQIAFILMSLRCICDPSHEDRELVELIWFPTGGGKTEAYLGLTAFTIFYNRLAGLAPGGADVIMRYTLRLLTTQQFQRASLLFCAMEHIRKLPQNLQKLGTPEFRLGMWVGGDATPNTRSDAKYDLKRLRSDPNSENPFILLKCPWCNAKFGPIAEDPSKSSGGKGKKKTQSSQPKVLGYQLYKIPGTKAETVAFRCNDERCEFGFSFLQPGKPPLPVLVIDEDILESPPNLVIGTVDKFALLSWKPETRSIFGLGADGKHSGLPPSLIIQDELHLISGPLGSMVGAYETVIEELCTSRIKDLWVIPKIVSSTATISRAEDQVRGIYARRRVMLFPPSGLESGDSFFAHEDRNEDGTLKPGRIYVGVMAPGHGSLQTTEARVFATLLQFPAVMPVENGDESERDPWWTLIAFFNSLRELGGAATLLVADARDYLRVIIDRHGYPYSKIRQLLNVEELTSRIRGDKIPLAIQKLEIPFRRTAKGYVEDTVEACLASSIIEVGIDIDRLSLMVIVGQPKTTSQYIQVSSRVGRSIDAPGLVVVAFSQSKPRDRSHYERFRSYHQRLYAQVEPTSVTPFSPPAVDRALHGIIVAAARLLCSSSQANMPRPFPLSLGSTLRKTIEDMIEKRVLNVDITERDNVMQKMLQRLKEWEVWNPAEYGGFGPPPENPPLIHPAGSREPVEWKGLSWPTLSSLRDVDASCEAEITTYYNEIENEVRP
jgi:hypothetical protein